MEGQLQQLLMFRTSRIPEFRQIIIDLPNHNSLSTAATMLEEAINDYIDHIEPNTNVIASEGNNHQNANNSFMVLNPAYNEEEAAWGGRRRTRRRRSSRRRVKRRGRGSRR